VVENIKVEILEVQRNLKLNNFIDLSHKI